MSDQKKTPSGGDREGASKCFQPKFIKPKQFLQEPIMWQVYRDCVQRFKNDPTLVNFIIAQVMALLWKNVFANEVLQ